MICVDASLAVKWVLAEPDSDGALLIYRDVLARGESVIVPAFIRSEVANAIWRRRARGLIGLNEAHTLLGEFLDFEVIISMPDGLHEAAFLLAERYGTRAIYDMHYVALAEMSGCDFWTADTRLVNAIGGRLPFVRALSTYTG